MSYNIEKELCVPEHLQCCEYIPHERIIEQYKVQHSIDSTTLLPQPTTVISAINTKITSSIPMYYDTTQPLPLDDALSLLRETSASYATTTTNIQPERGWVMPFRKSATTTDNQSRSDVRFL